MLAPSKRRRLLVVIAATAALVAVVVAAQSYQNRVPQLAAKKYTLVFEATGTRFSVVKVTTKAQQEKGLGGIAVMPADQGMLFVYNQPKDLCFWMKDTRIPLDIVWFDGGKRITHIESSVQPNSYPNEYCAEGQYALEINSGMAVKNNLKVGLQASF